MSSVMENKAELRDREIRRDEINRLIYAKKTSLANKLGVLIKTSREDLMAALILDKKRTYDEKKTILGEILALRSLSKSKIPVSKRINELRVQLLEDNHEEIHDDNMRGYNNDEDMVAGDDESIEEEEWTDDIMNEDKNDEDKNDEEKEESSKENKDANEEGSKESKEESSEESKDDTIANRRRSRVVSRNARYSEKISSDSDDDSDSSIDYDDDSNSLDDEVEIVKSNRRKFDDSFDNVNNEIDEMLAETERLTKRSRKE